MRQHKTGALDKECWSEGVSTGRVVGKETIVGHRERVGDY